MEVEIHSQCGPGCAAEKLKAQKRALALTAFKGSNKSNVLAAQVCGIWSACSQQGNSQGGRQGLGSGNEGRGRASHQRPKVKTTILLSPDGSPSGQEGMRILLPLPVHEVIATCWADLHGMSPSSNAPCACHDSHPEREKPLHALRCLEQGAGVGGSATLEWLLEPTA